MRKPAIPGCHGPRMPPAQVLAESRWHGARRRGPSVCALGERRQPERGGWQHPGSCGGARGVSRERGRQMSRGPAQPGLWRREVRASGRSLLDSRRSDPLFPTPTPGRGAPSASSGQARAAKSQGREQHFGLGAGRKKKWGAGGGSRDPKPKAWNLGKGRKKVG